MADAGAGRMRQVLLPARQVALDEVRRHARHRGGRRRRRSIRSFPTFNRAFAVLDRLQAGSELGARVQAELSVDAPEVGLDGLLAQEERARDLLVREAAGDELGDPCLRLAQLARRGAAAADAAELGAGLGRPERCAELLEDGERALERRACPAPLLAPPLDLSLEEQCARELEWHAETLVLEQ